MKILAIRGKNLASLAGEFVIPLEEGPLGAAGLFAITGATGAGKSTLLDALCLALFDAVPRLEDGSTASVGRVGEAEELRLKGNDVRGLLRRGTADGFAEVDFQGGDGRTYRARWEVRRARGRADGRLQPQSLSLYDLESGEFLGRTRTEVLELIRERLGLSFDQFRRSALLAQGDFAAFLKARPGERSELLERITGTEIYGVLSRAAHTRAGEEKAKLRTLEERLGDLRPLDADARADLERRCEETASALRCVEEEKGRLQARLDAHRRLQGLRAAEARAEEALREVEAAREGAAPRREALERAEGAQPLRRLVQQCDAAEKDLALAVSALDAARREHEDREKGVAREEASLAEAERRYREEDARQAHLVPLIRQARDLDIRIGEAAGALEGAEAERDALSKRLEEERKGGAILVAARDDARRSVEAAGTWLHEHDDDAVLARRWELWDGEFRRYARGVNELHEAQGEAKRLEAEGERLEEEVRGLVSIVEQADADLGEMDARRAALEKEATAFPPDALTREREELERRRERLRALAEVAREARRLEEERAGIAASAEEDRRKVNASDETARKSVQALLALRAALAEARRALESARAARKEDVMSLRARLREGEACLVCGALDHPWAGEGIPPFDRLVEEQGARVGALEKEEGATAKSLADAEAARDAALRQTEEKGARLASLGEALRIAGERWHTLEPSREGIASGAPHADVLPELASLLKGLEDAACLLREREKKEQECRRRLDEVRRATEAARRRRDAAQQKILALRGRMQEIGAQGGAARSAAAAASRACREAIEALRDPLGPLERWEPALRDDPKTFFVACRERAERWRLEEMRKAEGERALQDLAPELAAAETRSRQIEGALETAGKGVALRREALQKLNAERGALLDGGSADAVERRLASALKGAQDALDGARSRCAEAQRRLTAAAQTLAHCHSERARRQNDRDGGRRLLDEALAAGGWEEGALRRLLECPAESMAEERTALDALEARCREASVLLRERREQTAAHLSEGGCDGDEEEIAPLLLEAEAAVTTARSDWAGAEGERREDDRRRVQAGRLQEEFARLHERWSLWESLRELIGSADGNKFRAFAQSLTLDALLGHANRHLDDLARRYLLERVPGSDLELQIVDREMGDEVRPVHSLSGGESFLVSLALALALASLSSHRTRVESLFIDEGFGSLDPDTLDAAIASLDALQSLGRKVGVISHVPALVERIGVQVRVESLGSGRSRVHVFGTPA